VIRDERDRIRARAFVVSKQSRVRRRESSVNSPETGKPNAQGQFTAKATT